MDFSQYIASPCADLDDFCKYLHYLNETLSLLHKKGERLGAENSVLSEENQALRQKVSSLEATLKALLHEKDILQESHDILDRRTKTNSRNSSLPPSQDIFDKPAPKPKSLRKKSGKRSGGQKGHKGAFLKPVEVPDHEVFHDITACSGCGHDLSNMPAHGNDMRQVFDTPIPQIEVTAHHASIKNCPHCGTRNKADFPPEATGSVCYGPNIKGLSVYFQNHHFVPEKRTADILKDVFNVPISAATIANFGKDLSGKLSDWLEKTSLLLRKKAGIKHADETGFRIKGANHWLHCLSTPLACIYKATPKRGDIFQNMTGILVHDHFKSYFKLDNVTHALCGAHILRELQDLDEQGEAWATKMKRFLERSLRFNREIIRKYPKNAQNIRTIFLKIATEAIHYHEKQPPPKKNSREKRKGHNLALRLHSHIEDVLRYLFEPGVPFTNNEAERDMRMMKLRQKISGGFRTMDGAETFARLRSLMNTAQKQGQNILKTIKNATLSGNIPLPKIS